MRFNGDYLQPQAEESADAPCDDDLREMVVKGYARITKCHGRIAMDDECGQGRR